MNLDDILKSAVTKVQTQKKVQKKKTSKKETNIQQKQKLEIISDSPQAKEVDFDKIRIKVVKNWKDKQLKDWSGKDFSNYMEDRFKQRYGKNWEYNSTSMPFNLNKLKQKIIDCNGFCDNIVFRSYIDFFYAKFLDESVIGGKYPYWLKRMGDQYSLRSFMKFYKYDASAIFPNQKQTYSKLQTSKQSKNKNGIFSGIFDSYKIGIYNLVEQYGMFAAINFLVKQIGKSKQQAFNYVSNAINTANDRGKLKIVTENTLKYAASPKGSIISNLKQFEQFVKKEKNIELKIENVFYLTEDCNF